MNEFPQRLECEICFHTETDFYIVCANHHSFCWYCSEKITGSCPKCRSSLTKRRDHDRNHQVHDLLRQFCADLKQHRLPYDADVMDCDGNWCRATIINHTQDNLFQIHYYGWGEAWNEWIHGLSGRVMPVNTYTQDWIDKIHSGQRLEFMLMKNNTRRWYAGIVSKILPSGKNILIMKTNDCLAKEYKIRLDKEHITPLGTHTPIHFL